MRQPTGRLLTQTQVSDDNTDGEVSHSHPEKGKIKDGLISEQDKDTYGN